MKKEFNKKSFVVIKKAVDKKIIKFVYDYFFLKRQVAKTLFEARYISPFTTYFGVWNDSQVPETYSHYSDIAMEILLQMVKPKMEEETGLKLIPTYSYARLYKKGDKLERHKDRFSCEISTTLNIGGDSWPIFIEPDSKKGKITENGYISEYTKGIKINLKPGDMLVYKGNLLEHWREPFVGENCAQVFLHYNNLKTKGAEENKFDRRLHLGLPADLKRF